MGTSRCRKPFGDFPLVSMPLGSGSLWQAYSRIGLDSLWFRGFGAFFSGLNLASWWFGRLGEALLVGGHTRALNQTNTPAAGNASALTGAGQRPL